VSTRSTTASGTLRAWIIAHFGEASLPGSGAGELEDLASLSSTHEVLESALDRSGIRPLASEADRFLEKVTVKHKICPFHVYLIARSGAARHRLVAAGASGEHDPYKD
jgi:hypothetical protein